MADLPIPQELPPLPIPGGRENYISPQQLDIQNTQATSGGFNTGLRSGLSSVGANLNALAGQTGEALGLTQFAQDRFKDAENYASRAEQISAGAPKDLGSVKDFTNLTHFVSNLVGQGVASTLPAIGLGIGLRRPVMGAMAGMAPIEAGSQVQTLRQDPVAMAKGPGAVLANAVGTGLVNAGIDAAFGGEGQAARRALGLGAKDGFLKATGKAALGEGITEPVQNVVGQVAHQQLNPDKQIDTSQLLNEAIGGAITGGVLGGGSHIAGAVPGAVRSLATSAGELKQRLSRKQAPIDAESEADIAPPDATEQDILANIRTGGQQAADYLRENWNTLKESGHWKNLEELLKDPEAIKAAVRNMKADHYDTKVKPVIDSGLKYVKDFGNEILKKPDGKKFNLQNTERDLNVHDIVMDHVPSMYEAFMSPADKFALSKGIQDIVRNPDRFMSKGRIPHELEDIFGKNFKKMIADVAKAEGADVSLINELFRRREVTDATRTDAVRKALIDYMPKDYLAKKELREQILSVLPERIVAKMGRGTGSQGLGITGKHVNTAKVEGGAERPDWTSGDPEFLRDIETAVGADKAPAFLLALDRVRRGSRETSSAAFDTDEKGMRDEDTGELLHPADEENGPRDTDISSDERLNRVFSDTPEGMKKARLLQANLEEEFGRKKVRVNLHVEDGIISLHLESAEDTVYDDAALERMKEAADKEDPNAKKHNATGLEKGIMTVKTDRHPSGIKMNIQKMMTEAMRSHETLPLTTGESRSGEKYVADLFSHAMTTLFNTPSVRGFTVNTRDQLIKTQRPSTKRGEPGAMSWDFPDDTRITKMGGTVYTYGDIKKFVVSRMELRGITENDIQQSLNELRLAPAYTTAANKPSDKELRKKAIVNAIEKSRDKEMRKTLADKMEDKDTNSDIEYAKNPTDKDSDFKPLRRRAPEEHIDYGPQGEKLSIAPEVTDHEVEVQLASMRKPFEAELLKKAREEATQNLGQNVKRNPTTREIREAHQQLVDAWNIENYEEARRAAGDEVVMRKGLDAADKRTYDADTRLPLDKDVPRGAGGGQGQAELQALREEYKRLKAQPVGVSNFKPQIGEFFDADRAARWKSQVQAIAAGRTTAEAVKTARLAELEKLGRALAGNSWKEELGVDEGFDTEAPKVGIAQTTPAFAPLTEKTAKAEPPRFAESGEELGNTKLPIDALGDQLVKDIEKVNKGVAEKAAGDKKKYSLMSNADEGDKFSQMNVGEGPITEEQRQTVRDYIKRVLGDTVNTDELFEHLAEAGSFVNMNGEEVLKISTMAADPMSVGYHEAAHALMSRLLKADPKARNVLLRAANSPAFISQLNKLLKDHPAALEQIKNDPEERLAYAYQFSASGHKGLFNIGPETKTFFDKVKSFFRKVAAVWADNFATAEAVERGGEILTAFHNGAFANRSTVAQVLQDKFPKSPYETVAKMMPWVDRMANKFLFTAAGVVRDMNITPLTNIMDKFHTDTDAQNKEPGFLQAKNQAYARFVNKLSDVYKTMPTAERQKIVLDDLRSGKARTTPEGIAIQKLLDEVHQYMVDKGVKVVITDAKGNEVLEEVRKLTRYFPRVPNLDYLNTENGKKEFIDLLNKYNIKNPEGIYSQYTKGTDSGKPQEDVSLGLTYYTPAISRRTLGSIPEAEMAPFMETDLFGTMSQYLRRATRRAEYASRFGNSGEAITDAVKAAKLEGATDAQIKAFKDSVEAMEGSLGGDMDQKLKNIYGGLMTYQNIRLLPLQLFASLIDPLGIVVRGGSMREGFAAFAKGIRDLVTLGKTSEDDAFELAKTIGALDAANARGLMSDMAGGDYMPKAQRMINEKFFRYNGMELWNQRMRAQAAVAAQNFIDKHMNRPNKHSERFLAELGLKKGDALSLDNPKYVDAMNKWVDEAILRPNAAHRPVYMSDPNWMLISHLKQYTYLFQKVIVGRVYHEINNGNYTPAFALMAYVPGMIAADAAKALLTPGDGDDNARKAWTFMDYFSRGLQRAGLFGPSQFALDSGEDMQRGGIGIESIAGPTIQQLLQFLQAGARGSGLGNQLEKAIPGASLIK